MEFVRKLMDPSNAPRIVLENPKYIENLAAAKRAAACWGADQLLWTGERIRFNEITRTPRELRMKDYQSVKMIQTARPFDYLDGYVPVCIELLSGSCCLSQFQHPTKAVYIFGPEDGSVSSVFRRFCHYFVHLPSKYCLNLAATVNIVLYDRMIKEAH